MQVFEVTKNAMAIFMKNQAYLNQLPDTRNQLLLIHKLDRVKEMARVSLDTLLPSMRPVT
jgi:hypothetical protein